MRKIRLDDGVFNRMVGTDREISSYERFINLQKGINGDKKVNRYLKMYKNMVEKNVNLFGTLASLEDMITLRRIQNNLDIQLYVQREYIYARQACPRDTKNRDIRVCVGRVDSYPDSKNILDNPKVMEKAENIIHEYLNGLIIEMELILNTKTIKENEEECSLVI